MGITKIRWTFAPFSDCWEDERPDSVVWVDVAALDAKWRESDQYILPGGMNGQDRRYAKIGSWFAEHDHCEMAFASVAEEGLTFTNGRHRFAWLRDHGVMAIQLQVSASQEDIFTVLFGTALRASRLKVPRR